MTILKQINESEIYNVISKTHNHDDFSDGDLGDRIEEYQYYNHVVDFPLSSLSPNNYSIDEDKIEDLIDFINEEIKENRGLTRLPKITIDENGEIIDGCHRILALLAVGYDKIDLFQGTNQKIVPEYKKECVDEDLEIYKYSNDFGSISIMENAKYSPADNSVYEFLVKDEYQGIGVGTELLKMAMNTYPNLGAQVSSKASLKVFLECGYEPKKLTSKLNKADDFTNYDFKVFNKSPELLDGGCGYTEKNDSFNKAMRESIDLFMENGQSLYMEDQRELKQEVKNKRNNRIKI